MKARLRAARSSSTRAQTRCRRPSPRRHHRSDPRLRESGVRCRDGSSRSRAEMIVVPAQAGTQCLSQQRRWIPACAGMTLSRRTSSPITRPRSDAAPNTSPSSRRTERAKRRHTRSRCASDRRPRGRGDPVSFPEALDSRLRGNDTQPANLVADHQGPGMTPRRMQDAHAPPAPRRRYTGAPTGAAASMVVPAKAGTQCLSRRRWIPACAGMTPSR